MPVQTKKFYMKKLVLVIILLIPLKLFAPNSNHNDDLLISKIIENKVIENNLNLLKNDSIKTRKEVFKLAQPVIDIYLKRNNYHLLFPNMQDSVSYAITCIFLSESSNSLGQSAKSTLWLKHNNPFGLTSTQGVKLVSWELIRGEKIVMKRTFKIFNSFEEAISSLIQDYLSNGRFVNTLNSYSIKEFLFNLQRDGYCTNTNWDNMMYNIYLKQICLKE